MRLLRIVAIIIAALVLLVLSGLLLADHLTPSSRGPASQVLPLQPAQTAIDRQLAPLLAAHPDQSGVAFLSDGLDAFAARACASATCMISLVMPSILMSICSAVTPVSVPATLKSMSPR